MRIFQGFLYPENRSEQNDLPAQIFGNNSRKRPFPQCFHKAGNRGHLLVSRRNFQGCAQKKPPFRKKVAKGRYTQTFL